MHSSRISPNAGAGRIMVTDGGPHPPELWAQVIAEEIMDLAQSDLRPWVVEEEPPAQPPVRSQDPTRAAAALRLRAALLEALIRPFTECMEAEREKLKDKMDRVLDPFDEEQAEPTAQVVRDALHDSPWEGHFDDAGAEEYLRGFVLRQLATMQLIERSWHVDRNPDDEASKRFRAIYRGGE